MADRPSEFALIAQIFAPLATDSGAFELTDDVCLLQPGPGCDLLVTIDALVEGVHFLPDDPPGSVAKKALRVNLSDLAAKGGEPTGYLLALSLPQAVSMEWIEAFARGLREDQRLFGVSLLGGDTTSTPGPLTLAITAIGHVPTGAMIRRAGARPGDGVFVSGTIGEAGGGLAVLRGSSPRTAHADALIGRYRVPTPRLSLGRALRGIASSALDVSDGLIGDLGHIAEVSGVRLIIEASCIPVSQALHDLWGDSVDTIIRAATSGDDYEVAFTAAADAKVAEAARQAGVRVSRIGRVVPGKGVALVDQEGRELKVPEPGFRHF
jgi:thiamine-monophosphate kinase